MLQFMDDTLVARLSSTASVMLLESILQVILPG